MLIGLNIYFPSVYTSDLESEFIIWTLHLNKMLNSLVLNFLRFQTVLRGTTKEAVLYFKGGGLNGQLVCLQYGTLTLLMLQKVSKIHFERRNFLSPTYKSQSVSFVLFISVILTLITIVFGATAKLKNKVQRIY